MGKAFFRIIFLVISLIIIFSTSYGQPTRTWLSISPAFGGTDTLRFGFDSTATCGTDIHLGEGGYDVCPPKPPSNVFDVRWIAKCPDSMSFCGQLDYRLYYSPTQVDTYTITIQEGDDIVYPIKLKWSDEEIRYICDSAIIRIIGGDAFTTRMDLTDSAIIADNTTTGIRLIKYGAKMYNRQILSDPISFRVPLTFSDAGAIHNHMIYFGKHRDATYCLDTLYLFDGTRIIEEELPPIISKKIFSPCFTDSRSGLGRCLGEGTTIDIKSASALKDTHRIVLSRGWTVDINFPITISWPSGLGKFYQIAKLFNPSAQDTVDMLTDTAIVITDTLTYLLKIYTTSITSGVSLTSDMPEHFLLNQNYPNPFNPTTQIKFDLKNSGFVKLIVYDILGREVKILVNEYKPAGSYEVQFDASNLTSGIYFYKLSTKNYTSVKKMVLMR
jgi:hypothetical protein